MDKKQKKTLLKTMGGISASSILIASFAMQPTGSMKKAAEDYKISTAISAIQTSALAEQGSLSNPIISKATSSDEVSTHGNSTIASPFSIPDYVSEGHQPIGYDAEGDEVDLITQEQTVQKEVTLSNGETYLETHGWQDDLGNYMDTLPADASVGIENTPAEGNGDGLTYQKYTSRDNVTLSFTSGAPSGVVHGRANTQSTNGPTTIRDLSTGTWIDVDTGTTSGVVGDGTGGTWTHLMSAASVWPGYGYNPWWGSSGQWNNTARKQYIEWLWDYNLSSNALFYVSANLLNAMGWNRAERLHQYLWGGWRTTWNRSMFVDYFYYAQAVYGNAMLADNLYCIAYGIPGFGQAKQLGTLTLPWMSNVNTNSYTSTMVGTISGYSNRWPNGDGSGEWYDNSRNDDWTYYGPVFYSSNPTGYSGSTTVYGDVTSWSTSSAGSTIYDQNKVTYPALPINAEKQAVLGTNGPGVGDESGNTYYQGTITPSTTQRFTNAFTADSNPNWDEDEVNQVQVGDGSGRTYERALYYYDKDGNMIHDLPAGEFLYTEEDGADLFNSVGRSTNLDSTGSYEGVGIAETLSWISDNADTLTIATDARAIASDLGIEFVVTETDTKQKRLLIAIQAAVVFLTGATSNTEVDAALVHFASIVDISDADRNAITSTVSSTSISSITNAVSEGYREDNQFFGKSFKIFGSSATTTKATTLLNSAELSEFFKISSDIGIYDVDAGSEVVYFDRLNGSIAEGQFGFASVTNHLDPENALLQNDLLQHFTLHDWGVGSVADRTHLSNVRYTDFDYDKKTIVVEIILHIGDKQEVLSELVSFNNSYMEYIMNTLVVDEVIASADLLSEQPLITAAEYTIGSETDINANTASFALKDSFDDKFPESVKIIDIVVPTPPTEDQNDVRYEFTVEYEGFTFVHSQFFTFDKTRSQKYVEDAVAAIPNITTTVSVFDKTIVDLTSRQETFQPFEDLLVADGNTAARMSFSNVQLVGGGDIDRDATTMDITVDIAMGTYSIANVPLTLNLNHSVNEELINNLTEDEIVATSPGIVAIVDDFDPTTPEWDDSNWWKIQSSWLEMMDIAGIAVLGNFQKIDERNFEVDLEVTIGAHKKTIRVTQQVGFNLNFAPVLDESTTGISDPDRLEALREYMLRFNEQASVFYVGTFEHGFDAVAGTPSELLQAWEGTVATLSGDAVIRSVEITDVNAVTKYDRDVSFRITLEDSFGNTRTFDKIYRFASSPVAIQFAAATASLFNTTRTLSGQLTDTVLTLMNDINDYTWLDSHLNLLDTIRVSSVTNTGKTAHIVFELGYSGHLGDDSKLVSLDFEFDRRGDKDSALSMFGLGYSEAELSAYYDITNVDAAGNDWKNVEQLVLDELVKFAAQSTLRDDMEDEMKATHTSIIPNVWADQTSFDSAIDAITTTDIMALLQAEILAGGTTRTTFITNEWTDLRNEKMEEMILSDLASNWKLNSSTDALNEVLRYNSTFNIQDNYLADVITVVENVDFVTEISLEIAHATLLPRVLDTTLTGVSETTDPLYYAAIELANSNHSIAEYANNISTGWVNTGELITLIADSISQIIIDDQILASNNIINSTAHYNDRTITDLVKDLTIFTDEEIKIVGFDVENGMSLDRDSSSFNIEIFMTFGSIVNQKHIFSLDLDYSVNEAILNNIDAADIEIKDFFSHELASELASSDYDTWDKFGLSSSHILPSDNVLSIVDGSTFAIVGDIATSPYFTLDFTFSIGTTSRTITSQQRIGVDVIFDLTQVEDQTDTDLLDYLRGYNVADRVDYHGTWLHPYEILDATDAEVNATLTMYDGLSASGILINSISVHNRGGISEFSKTITLRIVAEDKNGFVKEFDKVITFQVSAAEWAFSEFSEANVVLKDLNILNGVLTDAVKANILADRNWYTISNHRNPVHIDDPIVRHDGKTATVSWRIWYDEGIVGGESNSKVLEIDYVFASRGSKDDALKNYGLEYSDSASDLDIDWTNVDGTNDWTNVEQDVLDELVRALAETKIRNDIYDAILNDGADYITNVWSDSQELIDEILVETDLATIAELAKNIVDSRTTRDSFITNLKQIMQVRKIEDNILSSMQTRWNLSSQENLLTLISQLNTLIDVKTYYQHDMHGTITVNTYAEDIARQMEIDTVRNSVSETITVGLDPTDARYTIYTNVIAAKLDATYDNEHTGGFIDVYDLINNIADSISREAINDLLADISSTIAGTLDQDTRVLSDIYLNLGAFDLAGILHSNIDIVNGDPLDFDSLAIPLSVDLIWGSVTNIGTTITMNLNQTVSQAMIEAIRFDEIGLIDPRIAPTADQVDLSQLTADQFGIFSRHILGSDVFTLDINTASFVADPIEPREFTMDVTIDIGAETRVITILASVGFDIFLDWESIDWDTATDAEKDIIDFMNSYDFAGETDFFGGHANPWQLRDESDLFSQFAPTRNLKSANGYFVNVVVKDPSSISKYDRSMTVTITVADKHGVEYDFDRVVTLSESYLETLTKNTNESHFDIVSSIQLTDMLTDATIAEMSLLTAYDQDILLGEFDIVELLSLTQSGKTATATFRVSYDNGSGHSGSKVIYKDFVFASRGSKDQALLEFGLGYTDTWLGIDWGTVDTVGNDWTNVEQSTLDQMVRELAFDKLRLETRDAIVFDSAGYVDNVFGSVTNLDSVVSTYGDNTELDELQALITSGHLTRVEWLNTTKDYLQTTHVERMILEALATEWKLLDSPSALAKAIELKSDFDITSYYSDIHTLVTSPSFDYDQTRQIGYDVFSSITRDLLNVFHTDVNIIRDVHYDNIHASLFESKYDLAVGGSWTQLTDFGKEIADLISHQFIADEVAKITASAQGFPTIIGLVDKNTRTLNDVVKDFSALETQYIDISNIRLASNGSTIGGDLAFEQILAGLSFGSVILENVTFTLEFDQTINFAIMEAILATEIRMTEYRMAETTDKINPDDILPWMFKPLSTHIKESDSIVVGLDSANPFAPLDIAIDPHQRRYTIGITLRLGSEIRTYLVEEKVGQKIVFGTIDSSRWLDLDILDDADEADFIAYNDAYPYVDSITYLDNFDHVLDIQSATEAEWKASLSKSLYVTGGGMTIDKIELKDAGTYTKYDKEFTFIMTLADQWGDTRVFEKTIQLSNSAVEYALALADETSFAFTHHDNTTAMLTDDTLDNVLPLQSSFTIDATVMQYLDVSNAIVEYKGKTVTIGFHLSYDDGTGYSDSRIIQIDIVFASRGSKDEAMANYSLGYDNSRLGIDWNLVDEFANDWTNVEQDVLDNLVKVASQIAIRVDINDTVISAASEYITNVWSSQLELSQTVDIDTTYALLAELQAQIIAGMTTRTEFITNYVEEIKTEKIESLLFENMATIWRLTDGSYAESRATSVKPDFDIKDYYFSNMDWIIQSSSFVDTITYDAFEKIYRNDIDSSMLASANDADKPKVTEAIDNFINDKIREVFALNIWTNDSSIVSHTSHLISEQAINDAMVLVGSEVSGTIDRDTRNIKDVNIDWQPLQYEGLYVSNVLLSGSTNGDFIDRDITKLPSSVSVTFGTIIDQSYLIDVQIDQTLNQAILGALTSSSVTLRNAKLYASVDYMLVAMGEDLASGGSGTITNAAFFESAVDYMTDQDATIALDPNNPLSTQPGSARTFSIGLIITAGIETLELEITVQVGESIDFSLPEFAEGGDFDFNPYFITTTSTYDNPYDLVQIGDEAKNHVGIDGYLSISFITLNSITFSGNDGVDIFSRQFVATFELQDQRGNIRTFVDQPVNIPGGINKAESIMATASSTDVRLADSTIVNQQLTDDMLNTTLVDLSTYSFGNDLDLLNGLQVKEVTHVGKHATVTIIVGYDDGAGAVDSVEYTYNYEFAYRADVAWSLNFYGLDMTVDQLGINWTIDQEEGNVEQDVIDNIIIAALQDYLLAEYENDLQTFVDANYFTAQEISDRITAFLDNAKIDAIAADGQNMIRADVIEKYKHEISIQTFNDSLDIIAVSAFKANDWAEVHAAYPTFASSMATSSENQIYNNTFDATNIESEFVYEFSIVLAPEVQAFAEADWLMKMIGNAKPGFLWMVHLTIAEQLSTGFDDAPLLTSGLHTNENSTDGWFIDELSNLTSFADMSAYAQHLSTKLARLEIPAVITADDLARARASLTADIISSLQTVYDDGMLALDDIDKYLDILLYVDEDHPQGFPFANYDAIFTPGTYFTNNEALVIAEQVTLVSEDRVAELGLSSISELLAKAAIYIEVNGDDIVYVENNAGYSTVQTEDEYRDLYNHYSWMLFNNIYEDAFKAYEDIADDNVVRDLEVFIRAYVSKMNVHLSDLEGIEYNDKANLISNIDLIAVRVDQIQNMPDIEAEILLFIDNIGLTVGDLDDSPYKDLKQFTITQSELEEHLYDEAMSQILKPGGFFDQEEDGKLTPSQIANSKVVLDSLMRSGYPTDHASLIITIQASILFGTLDDDYYESIINLYNQFSSSQTPNWTPTATVEEARTAMDPIMENIFTELRDGNLDMSQATQAVEDAKSDVAIELAWTKYEDAFMSIFEQLRQNDSGKEVIWRVTVQDLEEYIIYRTGSPSLSAYIITLLDADKVTAAGANPSALDMQDHIMNLIKDATDYAQDLYGYLIDDIATVSRLSSAVIEARTSILDDARLFDIDGTQSTGGTITEVHNLRAQFGKYIFELIIEDGKPDPVQGINGWLIPFAAMITKTDDYSTISKIIQERIEAGEGSFDNWGFEDIADMMSVLVDNSEDQETYNASTGKILMDKFISSADNSNNAWSTTMWMGPVPLRMTYGTDGTISSMETILLDSNGPEEINSISLSQEYSQSEMTFKFEMENETTVFVRYVEDQEGNINVIVQRLDRDNNWLTSEMYRETDTGQGIESKDYEVFRDSDLASFAGIPSDLDVDMIPIYIDLEEPDTNSSVVLPKTTIEHIWGANPTVSAPTDTGDATSSPVIVSKDEEGNTHIQMNLKDLKISNTPDSMNVTISSGAFMMMWLVWLLIGGLAFMGSVGAGTGGVFMTRSKKKQRFIDYHPQYAGASTSKILRLKKLLVEHAQIRDIYNAARVNETPTERHAIMKEAIKNKVDIVHGKLMTLEALVLAEADKHRMATGFKSDIKAILKNNSRYDNITDHLQAIPRGENIRKIQENTRETKFVQNKTQELNATKKW